MGEGIELVRDPSAAPERLAESAAAAAREGRFDGRLHYETPEQAAAWLRVHERHSPARADPGVEALYERAATRVAADAAWRPAAVLSLGCGGGRKDAAILAALAAAPAAAGEAPLYAPLDISEALVREAGEVCLARVPGLDVRGVVADLRDAAAVRRAAGRLPGPRLVLFFGILPNLEPDEAWRVLGAAVALGDRCLLSANLAPGADYAEGVRRVLPQYDNPETREWLALLPKRLGWRAAPVDMAFEVEPARGGPGVLRIVCRMGAEEGKPVELFASHRYRPELLREMAADAGFNVERGWVADSGEEGVFLVRRV